MHLPNFSRNLLLVAVSVSLAPAVAFGKTRVAKAARQPVTAERCEWTKPGHNPFMGDVVGAVDRYTDIPADLRSRLKARMAQREYDEIVSIRRDSIIGKAEYSPVIRDMHFGSKNRMCKQVTRTRWTSKMQERGLVYCEDRRCILVPTVCRNVARIARTGVGNERLGGGGGGGGNEGGGGGGSGGGSPGGTDFGALPPTSTGDPTARTLGAGELPEGGAGFAPAAATAGGPVGATDASGTSIGSPGDSAAGSTSSPSFAQSGIGQPFVGSGPIIGAAPGIVVPGPVVPSPADPVSAVPEPSTVLSMLAGLGALAALVAARRRRALSDPTR